jgi:hypothetical protein
MAWDDQKKLGQGTFTEREGSVQLTFFYYKKAKMFVPSKLFQLNLTFVIKARAYSGGAPFNYSTLRVLY